MVQSIDDARRRQRSGPGRVPPHNLEAEQSLLGAMLLSRDAIAAAVDVHLGPDDFYKPAHGHVYEAICSLYGQGEPVDHIEPLYERGETITGVPTGYTALDERLAGLQPSNLIIVGSRPAAGKTSLALGMASHAALHANRAVLFFSLEMSHLELTQRLLCAEARVDASRLRNGQLL